MSENIMWIGDTETTGLSPKTGHRMIEIGFVKVVDRVITDEHFHVYLDPLREVPDQAVAVHGMTREDLKQLSGGKTFPDVADDLLATVGGHPIVFHNAKFDMGFLDAELEACGRPTLTSQCKVFDTLVYANRKYPGQRNNLDALSKRLGISTPDRSLHGALLDSQILCGVYLAMTRSQSDLSLSDGQPRVQERTELNIRRVKNGNSLPSVSVAKEEIDRHRSYMSDLSMSYG